MASTLILSHLSYQHRRNRSDTETSGSVSWQDPALRPSPSLSSAYRPPSVSFANEDLLGGLGILDYPSLLQRSKSPSGESTLHSHHRRLVSLSSSASSSASSGAPATPEMWNPRLSVSSGSSCLQSQGDMPDIFSPAFDPFASCPSLLPPASSSVYCPPTSSYSSTSTSRHVPEPSVSPALSADYASQSTTTYAPTSMPTDGSYPSSHRANPVTRTDRIYAPQPRQDSSLDSDGSHQLVKIEDGHDWYAAQQSSGSDTLRPQPSQPYRETRIKSEDAPDWAPPSSHGLQRQSSQLQNRWPGIEPSSHLPNAAFSSSYTPATMGSSLSSAATYPTSRSTSSPHPSAQRSSASPSPPTGQLASGTLGSLARTRKRRQPTTPSNATRVCPYPMCAKLFSRFYNYKAHLETHDPSRPHPHPCLEPDCGKRFVRKTDLERHRSSVHEKKRSWRCEMCGGGFARKDTLRRHVEDGCAKRVEIVSKHRDRAGSYEPSSSSLGLPRASHYPGSSLRQPSQMELTADTTSWSGQTASSYHHHADEGASALEGLTANFMQEATSSAELIGGYLTSSGNTQTNSYSW